MLGPFLSGGLLRDWQNIVMAKNNMKIVGEKSTSAQTKKSPNKLECSSLLGLF